jgi:hypothetical protein
MFFQLPANTYGCSHEHAAFPGAVSISATTLAAVNAESLAHQGITALIIINAHGGNAVLTNVAQQANVRGPLRVGLYPSRKTGLKPASPRTSPAPTTTTCTPANSKRPFCSPRTRPSTRGQVHHRPQRIRSSLPDVPRHQRLHRHRRHWPTTPGDKRKRTGCP